MKHIETKITIKGSTKDVWDVLMKLEDFKNWNPLIIHSKGKPKLGEQITNTMMSGTKKMIFKPIITEVSDLQRFEWLGSLWVKGIFDGRHYFELKKLPNGATLLIHGEYFSGLLSGVIFNSIKESTIEGFNEMNEALKNKVE